MKPLIFLDIDGVLNSARSAIAHITRSTAYVSFQDRVADQLDPVAVLMMARVCRETEADIVISSTWRKFTTIPTFIEVFARYGWENAPVIGLTPITSKGYRGTEVKMFLEQNQDLKGRPYVCIDDDSDFDFDQRLIHCDAHNGFSYQNYRDTLEAFSVL